MNTLGRRGQLVNTFVRLIIEFSKCAINTFANANFDYELARRLALILGKKEDDFTRKTANLIVADLKYLKVLLIKRPHWLMTFILCIETCTATQNITDECFSRGSTNSVYKRDDKY